MATLPARVCVAALAGAFGVRGEARLKSFTAEPEGFAGYGALETEDATRRFEVRITRPVPGGFAVRLSGVATREDAEALKGTRLYASRDRLPPLPEDEFYHADLIGLTAFDTGGAALGRVLTVQNYGGGDFLEIARAGQNALLVPFTRLAVPTVDIAGGRLVVDPPEETVVPDFEADDG
jgi:16S rRNA processing protein RimM